ncbi:MAG: hypothetical protein ACO3LW_03215 [bacterium]
MPEVATTAEVPKIIPIQTEHWRNLLSLTDASRKENEIIYAWGKLKQQTEAHVPGTGPLVLDELYLDFLRLQVLSYPIVIDWKKPLTKREWLNCESQQKEVTNQYEQMYKLSVHLRKRSSERYPEMAPLFGMHQECGDELRQLWDSFHSAWRDYKKEWEHLHRQQQARKRREAGGKAEPGEDNPDMPLDEEVLLKIPQPPPLLNRERWHVLVSMSQMLTTELRYRCRDILKTPVPTSRFPPSVQRLIDDARQIQVQTNGFELLDKVKWVQRRNAQLVAELERLTREPIITPDLLNIAEENQPEREERKVRGYTDDGSGQTYGREENRTERKKRPIWWWMGTAAVVGTAVFLLAIFLPSSDRAGLGEKLPQLVFKPTGPTRTVESNPALPDPEPVDVKDMQINLSFDMPTRQVSKGTARQLESSLQNKSSLPAELSDLGAPTAVLEAAGDIYLYWADKLTRFENTLELQRALQKLERQYQQMQQNLKNLAQVPFKGRVVPTQSDGEARYGVEWQDESGNVVGTLYENDDGTQLRLRNGEVTEGIFSPYELTKLLEEQASQR